MRNIRSIWSSTHLSAGQPACPLAARSAARPASAPESIIAASLSPLSSTLLARPAARSHSHARWPAGGGGGPARPAGAASGQHQSGACKPPPTLPGEPRASSATLAGPSCRRRRAASWPAEAIGLERSLCWPEQAAKREPRDRTRQTRARATMKEPH